MKKLILASAFLGLTACSVPSVDDLVEDPKLLAKVIERCEKLMDAGKADTQECRNAVNASKRLVLQNAEDALKAIKKNARIVLKDAQKNTPELLEELQKNSKEAMQDAKQNADEIFEKAKQLLEDR